MNMTRLEAALGGPACRTRRDRIHNWTRLGLLPVVGEKHPGTGKVRQYADRAIDTARVLEDLTELGIGFLGREKFIAKIVADKKLRAAVKLLKEARVAA